MHHSQTYEVGISGEVVPSNHSGADSLQELLARDDLFAHQVTASLGLDLVLNV